MKCLPFLRYAGVIALIALLVGAMSWAVIACNSSDGQGEGSSTAVRMTNTTPDPHYFRDARTGLCFAYLWTSRARLKEGGPSLASVECTEQVEAMISDSWGQGICDGWCEENSFGTESGPRYFQDARTGQCFAYMWRSRMRLTEGGPSLAGVECSESVLGLVVATARGPICNGRCEGEPRR